MQVKRAVDRGLLKAKGNLVVSPGYVAPQSDAGCNNVTGVTDVTGVTGGAPTVTTVTNVTPVMQTLVPQPEVKPVAHYDYDTPF
jgi:hypothetical protein